MMVTVITATSIFVRHCCDEQDQRSQLPDDGTALTATSISVRHCCDKQDQTSQLPDDGNCYHGNVDICELLQ